MVTAALLEPLLRAHLHPAATCAEPVRAAAGNGQETWLVDAHTPDGPAPLVLRRSAPDGTLGWTDRRTEFAALEAAGAAGLPVPRVRWLDGTGGALEHPYFVMDRLPGRVPGRLSPDDRDALSRELGGWLARLHALDPSTAQAAPAPAAAPLDAAAPTTTADPAAGVPPSPGTTADPAAGGPPSRPADGRSGAQAELEAWRGRYEAERLAPIPLLGALFAWLEANPPAPGGDVSVLWGDAGPHNLLVEDGRITALLDWELVHLGDPLDDLAVVRWSCFGTLDPELVLAGYEAATGVPVDRDRLRWFAVLACASRATMLLAGVRAFAEGRTSSPSLAGLGLDLLSRTLARGAAEAGWVPADGPSAASTRPAAPDAGPAAPGAADAGNRQAPTVAIGRPDAGETTAGVARFLARDVLPAITDGALRRGVKTAVALLETAALRSGAEPAVLAERDARAAALLRERGLGDDLEAAARACELDPARTADREAVRALLLADHADADALLAPLRRLFG